MTSIDWRKTAAACLAAALAVAGGGGGLGKFRIVDFPPSIYPVSGSGWNYYHLDLVDNAQCDDYGPCGKPLGFSIDFGAGPVDSVYVSENGVVTFGGPLPAGDTGNSSLNGYNHIAALYTDLRSVEEAEDAQGEITYAPGRIDSAENPSLDDDTSPLSWFDGKKGFKIDWASPAEMASGSICKL